jgi:tight adherence protein B
MVMIDSIWVTAALVFIAVVCGTLSLALLAEGIGGWIRLRRAGQRLQELVEERGGPETQARVEGLLQSPSREGIGAAATRLADAVPARGRISELLEQARLDWSPETFILRTCGLGFGAGFTVLIVSGSVAMAAAAATVASTIPYVSVRRRRTRRFRNFEEQFPEAIQLLTRAIRAGHPLMSGMRMVADEGPPEVAAEFRRSVEEQRYGLQFEDALLSMVDRTDLLDVRIFAIAVLVQREVGGNLAEILDNLGETIRGRFYLRRQLRVYTAQGRLSGYALAALPFGVGGIVWLMQPEYIGLLFTTVLGWFMVGSALFLQLVGVVWIRKIINIDI